MTPARRSLVSLVILSLVAACGDAGGASGSRATAPLEPTVRDSAGVTIYEHPPDALERAPLITIDSAPLAVFAGDVDDPGKDVSTIRYLTFTGAGDLVGYDGSEHQFVVLRVSDHRYLRYGRRGGGPGEIGSAGPFVMLPGDTALFVDGSNDRFTFVHPDTGIVRTVSRGNVVGLRNTGVINRVGDSVFLLSGFPFPGGGAPRDGRVNTPRELATWVLGADSVVQRFTIPGGWMVMQVNQGSGPGSWTAISYGLPFASFTQFGRWGDGFLVVRGEQWVLEHWDTAGQLSAVVRVNRSRIPVTESLFDSYVESDAAEMARNISNSGHSPNLDSIRASIRERGHADSVAAITETSVTTNGTIWVLDNPLPDDSLWTATAVAPSGEILGRVSLPGGKPIAWGDDRVAFRTEDDLGIATITVKRLRMPK